MKKIIKITNIEDGLSSKNQAFTKIKTGDGHQVLWCWDVKRSNLLKQHFAKGEEVEIEFEDGKFAKITHVGEPAVGEPIVEQTKPVYTPKAKNNTTMYVSYAKDVFISLKNQENEAFKDTTQKYIMDLAITLVKQAREAFEDDN